jgi:hypothetical protein
MAVSSGAAKLLSYLEHMSSDLMECKSGFEGIPTFEDETKVFQAVRQEDGSFCIVEVEDKEEYMPLEYFDSMSYDDTRLHIEKGYGFSISYDPIKGLWLFFVLSNVESHNYLVEGEDLFWVLKSALTVMNNIKSDFVSNNEFMDFCDTQMKGD